MPDVREVFRVATDQVRSDPDALQRQHLRQRRLIVRRRVSGFAIAAVILIAAIAVAVAVMANRGSHGPRPQGPPGTRSMHNGPIELFGMTNGVRRPDGTFAFKCAGGCTEIRGADWSPDGTRLAVITGCGGSCASDNDPYHGIRVIHPSTGIDQLLVPGEITGGIAWSPDGDHLAYVDHGSIFVMNSEGVERRAVALMSGDEIFPSLSWSPDGSRIAYSEHDQIVVVRVDGSGTTTIAYGSDPAWSPDGASIAYLSRCVVRLVEADGSSDMVLANLGAVRGFDSCNHAEDLVWSPDGRKLAAMAEKNYADIFGPATRGVFIVNADGSGARRVSLWNRAIPLIGLTWQPVR